ncbi:hypothetical protein EK21DRAFT_85576 [Setomelanomma holmii]|uniref:Maintenance of telomere capping protein 6 n=1 Tax=Setomelanomma holmii TaxID=210430 RepID=A0A9P4LQD9_9PLEO|nr:hypothetical protein EK21DRAFT_85576 [Setomelanomma holmii]
MSGNSLYDPDQNALDTRWIQPWSEAFRAQRDVGLRVPINFHTIPAVSLTQACFSANQYEHNAFQKCFSNLLGVGFRRFTIDTYWDALSTTWSLCPVEQPRSNDTQAIVEVTAGLVLTVSTNAVSAKIPETTAPALQSLGFERRQDASSSSPPASDALVETSTIPVAASSPVSSSARPTVTSFPTTSGPPLMQIGKYNCTLLMQLNLLTGILGDFLDSTATTTGASLILLTLDVHAASSILDPNAPAPRLSQPQLPVDGQLLSDVMKSNLSDVTYTPSQLEQQRGNLNTSWNDVDWPNRPEEGYYNVSYNFGGNRYTVNGWPTEAFIEFKKFFRLGVGYGSIDSQMGLYNIGTDLEYIFPPGTFSEVEAAVVSSDGRVSSGCLFDAADTGVTTARNSSWAIIPAPALNVNSNPDLMAPIPAIKNLTSCGISPILNQTLAGATADKNPLPYAAYVHSTVWSWAPGEPLNATSNGDDNSNRCATISMSPYPGRWRVTDCSDRHRVACHLPGEPYNWEISNDVSDYNGAASACRSPYIFSVPHTALENAHLLAAMRNKRENNDEPVFIDLNAINVPDCWVIGTNGTCPYLSTADINRTRIVVVPTVAAVIIFVLAALTFFVKCAANRRENKRGRRRRMVGGWEYEGVPS